MSSAILPNALPPVIRIFISSTFSDMEQERNYFNSNVAPKLKRVCAQRGVSFFSVDLRWGITEEDQINGQVLPICLSEIDRCRPFFIGIIGNRYGSVMEEISGQIGNSIPWLIGKEGKSITEIEMLYAVLDQNVNDTCKDSAFYIRSEELSEKLYGETEENAKLAELKNAIRTNESVYSTEYNSIEEFGEAVYNNIIDWLDSKFPAPEDVSKSRRVWYDNEILRNYIHNPSINEFLNNYLSKSTRSLLIYGDGARGKTTFLTAWTPTDGKKILINCGSDDMFLYWPSITSEIISQLNSIDASLGFPKIEVGTSRMLKLLSIMNKNDKSNHSSRLSSDLYFVTDEERESFRLSFLQWIAQLNPKEKIYIFINDLNLLEDESSALLSWLPVTVNENIHFICTTNNNDMVKNAETLGWNCKEMPKFSKSSAKDFLLKYLNIYGKKLSEVQLEKLLLSDVTNFPGNLKSVANFLIECGRFHNLGELIENISGKSEPSEIFYYIYEYSIVGLTDKEIKAIRMVFGIIRCSLISLSEQECFDFAKEIAHIGAIEWARIQNVFEQFELINGDYWSMRNKEVQKFVDKLLTTDEVELIQNYLGDHMFTQLHTEKIGLSRLLVIRENTAYAKAALIHYRRAKNWEKLKDILMDNLLLFYLSKLDWQVVLRSWFDIFLNSDINIPEILMPFLENCSLQNKDNYLIALRIASLFSDLSFRSYLPHIYKILGTKNIPSVLEPNHRDISEDYIDIYNKLCKLKKNAEFRTLYKLVNSYLAETSKYTPIELCKLMFFKADCESKLHLLNECMETTNFYYKTSLAAASSFDLRKALSMRGDVLYRLGKYTESSIIQEQIIKLSVQESDIRSYLGSLNVLAMCLYRVEKFSESISQFEKLIIYWQKLDEKVEVVNCWMNKCNALQLSGDTVTALKEAKQVYSQIPSDAPVALKHTGISLLSNIGYYMYLLGDNEAEKKLLQVMKEADDAGMEHSAINVMNILIRMYKKDNRCLEVAEISEKLMNLLWERREYREVTKALKLAVETLLFHRYNLLAEKMKKRWKERFAQLSGGLEFFEEEMDSTITDNKKLADLKEQLTLYRSEGDNLKSAVTLSKMAKTISTADRKQCVEYLLEAADLFDISADEQKSTQSLSEAVVMLFKKGVVQDAELFEKVVKKIKNPEICRVIEIWKKLGLQQTNSVKFDRNSEKNNHAQDTQESELLSELTAYSKSCEFIVFRCIIDMVDVVKQSCSAQQTIQLVQSFSENVQPLMIATLSHAMFENIIKDMEYLRKDYVSPKADKLLAYYEKCIQIFHKLEKGDIAALSGNIALIFRRKRDKEKTFKYHNMSIELYRKEGKIRDCLIEILNCSSAYREFDDQNAAIELLRNGLVEAKEANQEFEKAGIAGNLASVLIAQGNPDFYDEIVDCFEIEEKSFRNCNAMRDLTISLVNQTIFYLSNSNKYGDIWKIKLAEAEILVDKYDFSEFKNTLIKLKMMSETSDNNKKTDDEAAIKEKFEKLLSVDNVYKIKSINKEDDGGFYIVCIPVENSEVEISGVFLSAYPSMPNTFRLVAVCKPKMSSKEFEDCINKYTIWWNEQNNYQLYYDEEDVLLKALCDFHSDNWNDIINQFSRFIKFWECDKVCFTMMSIGICNLDMACDIKNKLQTE